MAKSLGQKSRSTLLYVSRYQTDEFGVVVDANVGRALIARGLAEEGKRRRYTIKPGLCIRLTFAGKAELI